jgi:hypothetical protein
MSRRQAIKHDDQVFAPQEEPSPQWMKDLAMAAPLLGFLLGCYVWMTLDILGVIA